MNATDGQIIAASLSEPVRFAGNNERIRAMAGYPNVKVVDWETLANERPELLTSDGVHLRNQAAYDFYANAITSVWAGTPPG